MIKTFLNGVQLPVNPFEDVTIKAQGNNKQFDIVDLGEVTKIGKRKLKEVTIKSLFTDNVYPFSSISSPLPAKTYVDNIYELMEKQSPTRLIITGDGMDINLPCSIEQFSPSQHFGETNEYYYTLELKEFREPVIKRVQIIKKAAAAPTAQASKQPVRATKAPATKTYTVKKGDCLWNIAKKYYGNGSQYTKIVNANKSKIKNPSLIYPGWVLVIP
jgi:nucleoid-associated protein YgaU